MQKHSWIKNLYLINFALLFTHEIDSAYWKEWILFRIPGGVQVFLLLNFLLLLAALFGFREVEKGTKAGAVFSVVLGCAGTFAFAVHSYFIRLGHEEFTSAASWILLWLIWVVSAVQVIVVIRWWIQSPRESKRNR